MKTEKGQSEVDEKEDVADEQIMEEEYGSEALARELESSRTTISNMEQALTSKDNEIAELRRSLNEIKSESEGLSKTLERAITAYRELALQTNPGVVSELIKGNTIDEINDSLVNARVLIDKVRQEIEVETTQTRVPPGAPQRSAPDISLLSPREKIQRALEGSSR